MGYVPHMRKAPLEIQGRRRRFQVRDKMQRETLREVNNYIQRG